MLVAKEVWFWIDTNNDVKADRDPAIIQKGVDEVVWRIRPGKHVGVAAVTIRLNQGSPFLSNVFSVPIGGSVSSGPAVMIGDFKYDIEIQTTKGPLLVLDPRVIVEDPPKP